MIASQVGDGIQPAKQHNPQHAMTFSFHAESRADVFCLVFIKITCPNQVREVSFYVPVLLCDSAGLVNDH